MVRPWKTVYDGIIILHMVRQWHHNAIHGDLRSWQIPSRPFEPVTQSFSQLFRAIRDVDGGSKTVSRKTFTRHLDRLVKEGTLHKYKKDGKRHFEYRLCTKKLIPYLDYLDSLYVRWFLKVMNAPFCISRWVNVNHRQVEIKAIQKSLPGRRVIEVEDIFNPYDN
jgi:hypothetical protein